MPPLNLSNKIYLTSFQIFEPGTQESGFLGYNVASWVTWGRRFEAT